MTRSGRVFGYEPPKKNDDVVKNKNDMLVKNKGKVVAEAIQEQKPLSKSFTDREADEFLKIIKRSDYRVVWISFTKPQPKFIYSRYSSIWKCIETH